jgi:aminoglycoside phosphotransferase (APT) family kinase protein
LEDAEGGECLRTAVGQAKRAPVPRILLADESKSLIGLNYVLMSKLGGAVLRTLEPALDDAERVSAYSQMGGVLRQIHGILMPSFGYIGPEASGRRIRAIAPICRFSSTTN